jgi:hypothetical protein
VAEQLNDGQSLSLRRMLKALDNRFDRLAMRGRQPRFSFRHLKGREEMSESVIKIF